MTTKYEGRCSDAELQKYHERLRKWNIEPNPTSVQIATFTYSPETGVVWTWVDASQLCR